jgi:hypothetical protein
MKSWQRSLTTMSTVAAMLLAVAAAARAESWSLELKKQSGSRMVGSSADYMHHYTSPQHFYAEVGPVGKSRIVYPGAKEQAAAFKRIVQKEPEYAAKYPFRGIAKLGSQEFDFVLDAVPDKPSAAKKSTEKKKVKSTADAKKAKDGSANSQAKKGKSETAADDPKSKKSEPPVPVKYNRLYFDFNHNGDLTDDKVIEAEPNRTSPSTSSSSYVRFEFPRVDITIDAGGTELDYAFFLNGYARPSTYTMSSSGEREERTYASVSLNATAWREGDIELEGKKRHVVLVDFNSNGRFDDALKLRTDVMMSDGRLYSEQGDMLLIDPSATTSAYDSPFDVTASNYRHHVSKLINIEGHYYDLEVAPAGDKLTLKASAVQLGSVSSPHAGLRGLLYGDQGIIKISGGGKEPIPLPTGRWQLLSYTFDRTGWDEGDKSTEKKAEAQKNEPAGSSSLLGSLAQALGAMATSPVSLSRARTSGSTHISACGTKSCPMIEVRKGETAVLPFGPPYKPVVTVDYSSGGTVSLGMSLLGAAGEVCTSLRVNGQQPSKPEFTILNPKDEDEVVQQGTFEYG